jgi:hypothetical protein
MSSETPAAILGHFLAIVHYKNKTAAHCAANLERLQHGLAGK